MDHDALLCSYGATVGSWTDVFDNRHLQTRECPKTTFIKTNWPQKERSVVRNSNQQVEHVILDTGLTLCWLGLQLMQLY